jgi:hypothetical protein
MAEIVEESLPVATAEITGTALGTILMAEGVFS